MGGCDLDTGIDCLCKEKNILVYGWDEIKVLDNKAGRDFVFDRYKEMGLNGIKIDYIDSDSKYAMMFRDTSINDCQT